MSRTEKRDHQTLRPREVDGRLNIIREPTARGAIQLENHASRRKIPCKARHRGNTQVNQSRTMNEPYTETNPGKPTEASATTTKTMNEPRTEDHPGEPPEPSATINQTQEIKSKRTTNKRMPVVDADMHEKLGKAARRAARAHGKTRHGQFCVDSGATKYLVQITQSQYPSSEIHDA